MKSKFVMSLLLFTIDMAMPIWFVSWSSHCCLMDHSLTGKGKKLGSFCQTESIPVFFRVHGLIVKSVIFWFVSIHHHSLGSVFIWISAIQKATKVWNPWDSLWIYDLTIEESTVWNTDSNSQLNSFTIVSLNLADISAPHNSKQRIDNCLIWAILFLAIIRVDRNLLSSTCHLT